MQLPATAATAAVTDGHFTSPPSRCATTPPSGSQAARRELTRGEAPLRSEPLLAITGPAARAAQPRSPRTTPCGPMSPRQGGWRPCGLVAGHALSAHALGSLPPRLAAITPARPALHSTPLLHLSHAQTATAITSLQRHKARRAPRGGTQGEHRTGLARPAYPSPRQAHVTPPPGRLTSRAAYPAPQSATVHA